MSIHAFDVDLASQDIQLLRDAGSIAVSSSDSRIRHVGSHPPDRHSEPLRKRIKRVELIADHEKLFQVYLIELQSVTGADIKAIGRAFRDKAGNLLFVLTGDY